MSPSNIGITKFTNCRVLHGDKLVNTDLWVSSVTGKVIDSQAAFFDDFMTPESTLDLGGRILAPGLIECQINGAFGFNFSSIIEDDSLYDEKMSFVNKQLIKTGVTSYLPTVTSQKPELYRKVLPFLGPSGCRRDHRDGSESLGAHVEGPFLSPTKNGIHDAGILQRAETFEDIADCYGAKNISNGNIRMITVAPEVGNMSKLIPELRSKGVICSIGHSEATYEEAFNAVESGAEMITHIFNAMRPLHHRNPGIFGVLGNVGSAYRPYFGIIADGIHLHPTTIKIAFDAHPDGLILVTDAMHMVGLPDGRYDWPNGGHTGTIVKVGSRLILDGTLTLIECVNNFLAWTGATIPQGLKAVTATPAAMLGLPGVKGSFVAGADADLVILSEQNVNGAVRLEVDEVWKFGALAFRKAETSL